MTGKKPIEPIQPLSDDELDAAVGGVVVVPSRPSTGNGVGGAAW